MSSVGQKMSFDDVFKWSEGILSPSSHTPPPASRGDKAPYSMTWVIGAVVIIIVILLLYMWYSNRAVTAAAGSGTAAACATPPPAQSSSPPLPSPSMPGVPSVPLPPRT